MWIFRFGEHLLMRAAVLSVVCVTMSFVALTNPCQAVDLSSFDLSNLQSDGRVTSEYRGRWSDDNDDHDLFTTLYLNLRQKEKDNLSATVLGSFNWDIGGSERRRSPFFDIYDTYDHDLQGSLYLLHVDVDDVLLDLSKLRLGRQHIISTDVIRFDGAKYEKRLTSDLEVYAFGGTRTSFYSKLHGEGYVAGSGFKYYPTKWTKFGVDYARSDAHFANDSVGVSLAQRISPFVQVSGRTRFLDEEIRDVRVRTRVDVQKIDLTAVATYFRQGHTLRQFGNEFSSYFRVLGDYHPFEQYGLLLYKGLGENYTLSAGLERREVLDEADVGSLNREFERYFTSIGGAKLLGTPLRGSVSFEYWDTDTRDRATTVSAETGITLKEKLDLDVGTDYAAYKYDLFRQDERANVRTYFAQARYKYRESSSISFRFEGETNEFEDDPYYIARLRWSVNF
jgi:hypothetical protein